jgi:hypothetical protein
MGRGVTWTLDVFLFCAPLRQVGDQQRRRRSRGYLGHHSLGGSAAGGVAADHDDAVAKLCQD